MRVFLLLAVVAHPALSNFLFRTIQCQQFRAGPDEPPVWVLQASTFARASRMCGEPGRSN